MDQSLIGMQRFVKKTGRVGFVVAPYCGMVQADVDCTFRRTDMQVLFLVTVAALVVGRVLVDIGGIATPLFVDSRSLPAWLGVQAK